jgi:hypothetical protein
LIDLGRKLQNTKCGEDDNVRAHFEALANFHEQLAAMGQTISDDQYTNTLMSSLPLSYDSNISIITTNADMSSATITPTTVIRIITDEYDKCMLKKAKLNSTQDEAFAAKAQKNKRKNKRDIECFNCHKKGHMRSDCWAKGGGKEGQGPKKKVSAKDEAAAAAKKTADDLEAWAAIEEVNEDIKPTYSPANKTEESRGAMKSRPNFMTLGPLIICLHSDTSSRLTSRFPLELSSLQTNVSSMLNVADDSSLRQAKDVELKGLKRARQDKDLA